MKPCASCGKAIANDAETCPACGGKQPADRRAPSGLDGSKETGDTSKGSDVDPIDDPKWLGRELRQIAVIILSDGLRAVLLTGLGAYIGYRFYDIEGLIAGAIIGFLLKLFVL